MLKRAWALAATVGGAARRIHSTPPIQNAPKESPCRVCTATTRAGAVAQAITP
jgi:hypothetical protein